MVVVVLVVVVVADAFMLPRSSTSSPASVGRQCAADNCCRHNPAVTGGTAAGLRSFSTLRHRRRRPRLCPAGPTEGTAAAVAAIAVVVVANPCFVADAASAVPESQSSSRGSGVTGVRGVSDGATTATGDKAVLLFLFFCASTVMVAAALACPLDE